jgi:hypothetical protein
MTTLVKTLQTDEGVIQIITRNRWLYIFPLCYTSIVPNSRGDLVGRGTFIRWNTTVSAMLPSLHEAVIRLVEDVGISGLANIAAGEKRTHRTAKSMGMSYRELCDEAIKSRDPIPVLDGVLKHVRNFM